MSHFSLYFCLSLEGILFYLQGAIFYNRSAHIPAMDPLFEEDTWLQAMVYPLFSLAVKNDF